MLQNISGNFKSMVNDLKFIGYLGIVGGGVVSGIVGNAFAESVELRVGRHSTYKFSCPYECGFVAGAAMGISIVVAKALVQTALEVKNSCHRCIKARVLSNG